MKTWDERAREAIAQSCCTYSKRSDQFVKGVYPTHVDDTLQEIYDNKNSIICNGKEYTDFIAGLGSNLISCNNNYSLPSECEVVLAERLKEIFPFIDRLKILKTGSEACQAAVRIARAYTENIKHKRKIILISGYHGWHSVFISCERPGTGTFYEHCFKFKSLNEIIEYIEYHTTPNIIAGVIIEPVMLDLNVKDRLQRLRNLCTTHNIPLIFDEVITGFRFPKYCVSNYFGIEPDLICLGKALGNGHPISIIGGKKKYMETPGYFISSTFAGEAHSIKEALKVLDFLSEDKLQELWDRGKWFKKEFNSITPRIQLKGYSTRAVWEGEELYKAIFMQEMVKKGYLLGKAFFLMFAHTVPILEKMLKDSRNTINHIESNAVGLEGSMPQEVFKRN